MKTKFLTVIQADYDPAQYTTHNTRDEALEYLKSESGDYGLEFDTFIEDYDVKIIEFVSIVKPKVAEYAFEPVEI